MFFIASLLILSSLEPLPFVTNESEIKNYSNSLKIPSQGIFSQKLADCLKDIQGVSYNFETLSQLEFGDILLLGHSENAIEIVAIYQDEGDFIYAKNDHNTLEVGHGFLKTEWQTFSYRRVYRRPQEITETAETFKTVPIFWNELLQGKFINKAELPFVLTPRDKTFTIDRYIKYTNSKQWQMQSLLNEHGALLLRGFPVSTPEDFAAIFGATVGKTPVDYIGEGSRKKITAGVYSSTEAPPEFHIHLHHELSCTNHPASYISFYCEVAPSAGSGQTILGRTQDITKALHKKNNVWDFFENKNLKYVSRHPPTDNFYTKINKTHKTWPQVFQTEDRAVVEKICREKDLQYEWDGDWIHLTRIVPAIRPADKFFPYSYWFNQLHLYHANPRNRGGFLNHFLASLLYIDPSTRQYEVTLEEGTEIPQSIVYEICDTLEAHTIKFDWQKGDILILDNRRCLHGRAPTDGARKILVSMTD